MVINNNSADVKTKKKEQQHTKHRIIFVYYLTRWRCSKTGKFTQPP